MRSSGFDMLMTLGRKMKSISLSSRLSTCPSATFIGKQVSETERSAPLWMIALVVASETTTSQPSSVKKACQNG